MLPRAVLALGRLPVVSGLVASAALAMAWSALRAEEPAIEPVPVVVQAVAAPVVAPSRVLLALEVETQNPACAYYSAFDVGAVEVEDGEAGKTLHRRFSFEDGCEWESTETLTREPDGRYAYGYSEHVVSCRTGRIAAGACTRAGHAVPVDVDCAR